ncbi:Nuclear hormone receptor domain containing protein [Aphelenchoides fujianensis]|nr:Nuclear hormone receptor domain containing protein [Aphelenchoides fujianensis]
MNLNLEEAFFSAPRRLASRTKMVEGANKWMTIAEFRPLFCRSLLYCVDVVSHTPELRSFEPLDQMRLVVQRGIQTGALIGLQRTMRNTTKKCILIADGYYVPLEAEEVARYEPERAMSDYVEFAQEFYDNVFEAFKAARLSDEEFLFLRMLVFFAPVAGLSASGRELLRETHDYCLSLFIRFLLSKHDRQTALKRMADLLGLLPLIEQAAGMSINYTSRAILFNYAEFQGNLMLELHSALTSRLSIA